VFVLVLQLSEPVVGLPVLIESQFNNRRPMQP